MAPLVKGCSVAESTGFTRRHFLTVATLVTGGAGAVATAVPFVASFNPSARAQALGGPVQFDISKLEPGALAKIEWRGRPIYVVHRTEEMLGSLGKDAKLLRDPGSEVSIQPSYATNEYRSLRPAFLVLEGVFSDEHEYPLSAGDMAITEAVSRLEEDPEARGFEDAGLIVINTCAIREGAEQKVIGRQGQLARLKDANPRLRVVLTGCSVREPDKAGLRRRFPAVDLFLRPDEEPELVEMQEVLRVAGPEQHHRAVRSGHALDHRPGRGDANATDDEQGRPFADVLGRARAVGTLDGDAGTEREVGHRR